MEESFQDFAVHFFEAMGLTVRLHSRGVYLSALDSKHHYAVEVKLYRSLRVPNTVLENAALRLRAQRRFFSHSILVLFTSALVTDVLRRELWSTYKVRAIGYAEIRASLSKLPLELENEFNAVTASARLFSDSADKGQFTSETVAEALELNVEVELHASADAHTTNPQSDSDEGEQDAYKGEVQAKKLEAIPSGANGNDKTFEAECVNALKLLFGKDLTGWSPQNPTKSGLHRFDLIARIVSQDDFWKALISDFRTRYVIFEFKNHKKQISQGQVYTTEKYVYPAAMRGTAIIISREGPDDNAREASHGALRENSKLILHVTRKQLCTMLRGYDQGENASDLLSEILYDTLRSLDR